MDKAIAAAVEGGRLWLAAGPASLLGEPIPTGLLNEEGRIAAPPPPVPLAEILPESLPEAWSGKESSALALLSALSQERGFVVPWKLVRETIDGALSARFLALANSAAWPADFAAAATVKLRLLEEALPTASPAVPQGLLSAEAQLEPDQIQDLAEKLPDLLHAAAGLELRLRLRVELGGDPPPSAEKLDEIRRLLEQICRDLHLR